MLTHIHTIQASRDVCYETEVNYKHTCVTQFQGITGNIYDL